MTQRHPLDGNAIAADRHYDDADLRQCDACDNTDEFNPFCEGCACCMDCCNCTETDCDCDACKERRGIE